MAKAKTTTVDVWKKKKWIPIYAPAAFRETFLGETPALENGSVKGKEVEASLMIVTGDMKRQGHSVTYRINDVADNRAMTEAIKFEIKPYAVRKFIRKNTSRIDDSFVAQTLDNKFVRVKPIVVLYRRAPSSIERSIRKKVSDFLVKEIKKKNLIDLFPDVAFGKIQREIYQRIGKAAPVKIVEIRSFALVENTKKAKKTREEGAEEVVEEEELIEETEEAKLEARESGEDSKDSEDADEPSGDGEDVTEEDSEEFADDEEADK